MEAVLSGIYGSAADVRIAIARWRVARIAVDIRCRRVQRGEDLEMRMSAVFMLGMISGVVVVGLWRRELRAYAVESSRRIRAKAADGMRVAERETASVAHTSGNSLHRAAELLQATAGGA